MGFGHFFCVNFQSKLWEFLEYKPLLIRIIKLQIGVLVVFDQRKEAHTLVKKHVESCSMSSRNDSGRLYCVQVWLYQARSAQNAT